ncbi:MAG: LytR C-terminal domain-containing protein [Acidobacteria bacterium]|nr:LytR C-terminal domain-containing protein [Acidobacteriota bacterium]
MPGKHAPASPASFYRSIARSVGGVVAVVGLAVAVIYVALSSGGNRPAAKPTRPPASLPPAIESSEPSPSLEPSSPGPTPGLRSPDPVPTTLPAQEVSVEVLNGTKRAGLAGKTADRLRKAGYNVVGTGNAKAATASVILYVPGAEDEALALQQQFPEFGRLKEGKPEQSVILRLVIGSDFP